MGSEMQWGYQTEISLLLVLYAPHGRARGFREYDVF